MVAVSGSACSARVPPVLRARTVIRIVRRRRRLRCAEAHASDERPALVLRSAARGSAVCASPSVARLTSVLTA